MTKINEYTLAYFMKNDAKTCPAGSAASRFPYYTGVELELENVTMPDDVPGGWTTHADDSLRNGTEFVTEGPKSGRGLESAITNFYAANIKWKNTPRASTHIHINAGDMNVEQLRTMFVMTYVLEDALFKVLEAKRKYCGYCMSLYEMHPLRMSNVLTTDNVQQLTMAMGGNNADKYYGFNINSIRKHGTVEFRYFPGGPSKDELISWITYCTAIKTVGKSISLHDLISLPDADALAELIIKYFGSWATKFITTVGRDSLYDNLQEIAGVFPDEGQFIRRDNLVFINDPLLSAVNKVLLQDPTQFKFFRDGALKMGVVSMDGWYDLLSRAKNQFEDGMKQQPKLKVDYPSIQQAPPRAPRASPGLSARARELYQVEVQRMEEIAARQRDLGRQNNPVQEIPLWAQPQPQPDNDGGEF